MSPTPTTEVAKDQAITANDQAFTIAARFAELALRGAGQAELADKVTPSGRRPGQTAISVTEAVVPTPLPNA